MISLFFIFYFDHSIIQFSINFYHLQLFCQRDLNEIKWAILTVLAQNDLHALPETLHVLLETQSSLRETFYDSHETVKGLHKTFFKMFHVLFFFFLFGVVVRFLCMYYVCNTSFKQGGGHFQNFLFQRTL